MKLQDAMEARRAIEAVLAADDHPVVRAMLPRVAALLSAEAEAALRVRSANASRQKRWRDQAQSRVTNAHVTLGGVGGGLPEIRDPETKIQENPPSPSLSGNARETVTDALVTRDRPLLAALADAGNPYADGASGMAISAWCEGVAEGTGRPCSRRSRSEVSSLCATFGAHARGIVAQPLIEWSRAAGEAYGRAAAAAQQPISAHRFQTWLDSGRSFGAPSSGVRVQPTEGRRLWKSGSQT